MIALLALHAILGFLVIGFGRRLGRRGFAIGAVAPVATLVWLGWKTDEVLNGGTVTQRVSWVGDLGLTVDLRLDGYGELMLLLIAGIGVAIFAYSLCYFPQNDP